jgi:hypothetical protein
VRRKLLFCRCLAEFLGVERRINHAYCRQTYRHPRVSFGRACRQFKLGDQYQWSVADHRHGCLQGASQTCRAAVLVQPAVQIGFSPALLIGIGVCFLGVGAGIFLLLAIPTLWVSPVCASARHGLVGMNVRMVNIPGSLKRHQVMSRHLQQLTLVDLVSRTAGWWNRCL